MRVIHKCAPSLLSQYVKKGMNACVQDMKIAPLSLHLMYPFYMRQQNVFKKDCVIGHGFNQGLGWL